jgi:hypothetical protein
MCFYLHLQFFITGSCEVGGRRHSAGGVALEEELLEHPASLSIHQNSRQRSLSDSCGTGEANGKLSS